VLLAVDRLRALGRADAADQVISWRRRGSTVIALAQAPVLLDLAEALGREADQLVGRSDSTGDSIVPAARAGERLTDALRKAQYAVPANLRDAARLARVAAGLSTHAAPSGSNEIYHRDLTQVAAVAHTLQGFGGGQALTPEELRQRVGVRFPTLARLPERPRLDELVTNAGLGLVFDDTQGVYRSLQGGGNTTGLQSRVPTTLARETRPVESGGAVGHRLEQSVRSRSFLTLGVPAMRSARLVAALEDRYARGTLGGAGLRVGAAGERTAPACPETPVVGKEEVRYYGPDQCARTFAIPRVDEVAPSGRRQFTSTAAPSNRDAYRDVDSVSRRLRTSDRPSPNML
jgi:hypothetical protein